MPKRRYPKQKESTPGGATEPVPAVQKKRPAKDAPVMASVPEVILTPLGAPDLPMPPALQEKALRQTLAQQQASGLLALEYQALRNEEMAEKLRQAESDRLIKESQHAEELRQQDFQRRKDEGAHQEDMKDREAAREERRLEIEEKLRQSRHGRWMAWFKWAGIRLIPVVILVLVPWKQLPFTERRQAIWKEWFPETSRSREPSSPRPASPALKAPPKLGRDQEHGSPAVKSAVPVADRMLP